MRTHTEFFRTRGNVRQGWERTMRAVQDNGRAATILNRRANGMLAHDETLVELADADCADAVATMIAERMRIRQELVTRALESESDEEISVLCCAAGFKVNSYSALLRMRRRRHLGAGTTPTEALKFFSGLKRTSAEKMLPRLVAGLAARQD
jgi:Uncharacterised protein conserved in bacteria (DUF2336)